MRKSVKKLWLAALKSGEYKHGEGRLRYPSTGDPESPERFCCLGVLCDVAKKKGVIKSFTAFSGFLPPKVRKWAGLLPVELTDIDEPKDGTHESQIARINDMANDYAPAIAYIENNL